jgi:hypothetical protein
MRSDVFRTPATRNPTHAAAMDLPKASLNALEADKALSVGLIDIENYARFEGVEAWER